VFVTAFDPGQTGLVASLNRPGGNVTGITLVGASLGGKRLELARELVPNVRVIALITNPNSPDALEELHDCKMPQRLSGRNCSWCQSRAIATSKRPSPPSSSTAPGCC
jgi:putative ABC transport system substrate-binding protein